jgi:hypothetical protein
MAYVPGEHWILCSHCKKRLYKSEAVLDRSGFWSCKKDVDKKQMSFDYPTPKVPTDPRPLDGRFINVEGADIFYTRGHWEDIDQNWEDIETNWSDL